MTDEEVGGIVRTVVSAGLGILVGKGVLDSQTALVIAGAVGTIAVAVWSVLSKRKRA
jgi:ABC-type proline/glycine betaine transport system permease subunit